MIYTFIKIKKKKENQSNNQSINDLAIIYENLNELNENLIN